MSGKIAMFALATVCATGLALLIRTTIMSADIHGSSETRQPAVYSPYPSGLLPSDLAGC